MANISKGFVSVVGVESKSVRDVLARLSAKVEELRKANEALRRRIEIIERKV